MISLLVFRLIPVLCYISFNFPAAIPEIIEKNLPFLDENVINTKDEFLFQKIDNGTLYYLVFLNVNYIPPTEIGIL